MSTVRQAVAGLVLAAAWACPGCTGGDLDGPPPLLLGRDVCAECGMLVSEGKSACGGLIEKDGAREHVVFDDLGCLFDFERGCGEGGEGGEGGVRVLRVFVRDRGTEAWVEGGAASVLVADGDRLRTPMGSGMAAYGGADRARAAQGEFGGVVLSMDEARAARRAGGPGGRRGGR